MKLLSNASPKKLYPAPIIFMLFLLRNFFTKFQIKSVKNNSSTKIPPSKINITTESPSHWHAWWKEGDVRGIPRVRFYLPAFA